MKHNDQTKTVFRIPTYPREEVTALLKEDPAVYEKFLLLTTELQEELISFCMGNRGLKITYDPFFKEVFHPVYHTERLEQFLSCVLEEKVKIKQVLPLESRRLSAEASLIIMDMLVELESGGLINVEIQKISYDFPGPRGACYSSDLVMRQYAAVKAARKDEFSYLDLGRVITIVVMESSGQDFHNTGNHYIHHFKQTSDTNLKLNLLQEYIFITLDVFREITHNISTELEAWMYFLSSDKPADIMALTEAYPYFKELYSDIIKFQRKPKELVNMFSEALEIMDRNAIQHMIKDRDEKIRLKDEQIEQLVSEIGQQAEKIDEQAHTIRELIKRLDNLESQNK